MLSCKVLEPCEKTKEKPKKPGLNQSKTYQKKPKNQTHWSKTHAVNISADPAVGLSGWPDQGQPWVYTHGLLLSLFFDLSFFDFNFDFFFELKIKCIRL
jgi:hypothetical protein